MTDDMTQESYPPEHRTLNELAIGRVVHYVARGSADGIYPRACRSAMITEIGEDGRVGLAVLNPDGMFFHPLSKAGGVSCGQFPSTASGPEGEGPGPFEAPATWHWFWGCSTLRRLGRQS